MECPGIKPNQRCFVIENRQQNQKQQTWKQANVSKTNVRSVINILTSFYKRWRNALPFTKGKWNDIYLGLKGEWGGGVRALHGFGVKRDMKISCLQKSRQVEQEWTMTMRKTRSVWERGNRGAPTQPSIGRSSRLGTQKISMIFKMQMVSLCLIWK